MGLMQYLMTAGFLLGLLQAAPDSNALPNGSQSTPCGLICTRCGHELGFLYEEVGGKYYDPECYICSVCGAHLAVRGQQCLLNGDSLFCLDCYRKLFDLVCAKCGKKITDGQGYTITDGRAYHSDCLVLTCSLCGRTIDQSYKRDHWGNVYHDYHWDDEKGCDYCGRLISNRTTGGGVRYIDGRYICNLCRPSAVDTFTTGEGLIDTVAAILSQEGIAVALSEIVMSLVDRDSLQKAKETSSEALNGFTLLTYQIVGNKDGVDTSLFPSVLLLYGMQRAYFIQSAAHELMHVWIGTHNPKRMEISFCEGSCNYAAYLVLQHLDDPLADYVIESMCLGRDIAYGHGFRRVKKMVEERGIPFWLEALKTRWDFPPGY